MANRSTLLATLVMAASLAPPAGHAADLPIFVGAPARQALACGALAEGFELDGTGTCLRVHGDVRADIGLGQAASSFAAPSLPPANSAPIHRSTLPGLLTTGRVDLDARTPTAYGPVRVYLSVKATQ